LTTPHIEYFLNIDLGVSLKSLIYLARPTGIEPVFPP